MRKNEYSYFAPLQKWETRSFLWFNKFYFDKNHQSPRPIPKEAPSMPKQQQSKTKTPTTFSRLVLPGASGVSKRLDKKKIKCRNPRRRRLVRLPSQNTFPAVHAGRVRSPDLKIYNTIFPKHQTLSSPFSTFSVWTSSEQTNRYRALLWKTITLWPPTCIIALFLE